MIYYSDDDFDFNKTYHNNSSNNKHNNDDGSIDSHKSETEDAIHSCLNCGSESFYRDPSSDALICSECHTQSQSQSQREVTDYDTAMEVGATTSSKGRLIGSSRRRRSSAMGGSLVEVSDRLKKDHELDNSTALPSVVECCSAYQIILQAATKCIARLASPVPIPVPHNSDDDTHTRNMDSSSTDQQKIKQQNEIFQNQLLHKVQHIWFAYLSKWNEASVHYSKLYPEQRLSFRDYFLNKNIKTMLIKYLSAKAVNGVRQFLVKNEVIEGGQGIDIETWKGGGGAHEDVIHSLLMTNDISADGEIIYHNDDEYQDQARSSPSIESQFASPSPLASASSLRRKKRESAITRKKRKSIVRWKGIETSDEEDPNEEEQDDDDTYVDDENDDKVFQSKKLRNDFDFERSLPQSKSKSQSTPTITKGETPIASSDIPTFNPDNNPLEHKVAPDQYKYFRKPITSIQSMLNQSEGRVDDTTIQPYYAIFKMKPDLNLLSSIIYLALLQCNVGIASHHFVSWARSGLYPYFFNGLKYLPLPVQEKMKDCSCTNAFCQKNLPKPALLDYYADLLIVSLGLDTKCSSGNGEGQRMERVDRRNHSSYPFRQMRNFPSVRRNELHNHIASYYTDRSNSKADHQSQNEEERSEDKMFSPQHLGDNTFVQLAQNSPLQSPSPKVKKPSIKEYYQENIPMMAYRFVTDLGLCQRVLDLTLALIGFDVQTESTTDYKFDVESFIPKALKNASIDKIASPVHLIAVIVVACKMCYGWEKWQVHMTPNTLYGKDILYSDEKIEAHLDDYDNQDESDGSSQDKDLLDLRKKKQLSTPTSIHQQYIPWTDEDIDTVRNGPMVNNYFKFIEEMYGDDMRKSERFEDMISCITQTIHNVQEKTKSKNNEDNEEGSSTTSSHHDCDDISSSSEKFKPNTILAGGTNPNMPAIIKSKNGSLFHFLCFRHKGAMWAQANGYGEYVMYKDIRTHAATKRQFGKFIHNENYSKITCEPFHPHYGLLIEYVSDKLYVEPGELHYLVSCLDEEISQYSRPYLDWSFEHNANRRTKNKSSRNFWHTRKKKRL